LTTTEISMRAAIVVLMLVTLAPSVHAQDGPALYTQHCAECHEGGARAPSRQVLSAMTPDRIAASLESGLMRVQGEALTAAQRRVIAAYLSTVSATAGSAAAPRCESTSLATTETDWNTWGVTLSNDRIQRKPGLTVSDVPSLKLRWAFGFEGEVSAAANPTIVGNRVFVGSASGRVYSLGLKDGCLAWTFKADGGVRAAVVIGPVAGETGLSAFVVDLRATLYRLDAATGELKWKKKLEEHRSARISGSPVLYGNRLFVPIASGEEGIGAQATYECCTFRGSLVALDAATGDAAWQTFFVKERATPQTKNAKGTTMWGPSGAAVWASPTIDPRTRSVYVATGDSYSQPAAPMSDAIVAMDLDSGAIKWVYQATAGDAFNMACTATDRTNCPQNEGPDHDFGQSPILIALPNGRRVLVAGQKSGVVHGLDPDDGGRKLWERKIGRGGELGGIEWGSASDGENVYVPLSDVTFKDKTQLGRGGLDSSVVGGLFAIHPADGSVGWTSRSSACSDRASCSPALSAPAALIPGVVFAGSLDGHLRAYATRDGSVLWDVDTAVEFPTVNSVAARGGSIDVGGPAIANGVVLTTSGYGTWGGIRGNVLLAFSVDGR
jgi:polyvinyl alcohol dehydrogenase (cytochrome)